MKVVGVSCTSPHSRALAPVLSMATLKGSCRVCEKLTTKAGEKALASASTFQDYAYICFDDDERCSFSDTEIYKTAAAKAVELKDQADEDQMDRFKMMLDEWEDEETLGLL